MKILLTSSKRSLHDLAGVLIRRFCGVRVKSSLTDPCMILCRSFSEDLVQILIRSALGSPCMRILQRVACRKALPGCSWELLCGGPGRKILVKVFCKSLWEDRVEILVQSSKRSLHDLAQVLVRKEKEEIFTQGKTSSRRYSCDNIEPDLLLFRGYCCLYLVLWLPAPHTVWGLLPFCIFPTIIIFTVHTLQHPYFIPCIGGNIQCIIRSVTLS